MISYGNVYKQGVEWLNQNAEENARLTILDGYMLAASPVWWREDISISPDYFSGLEQKGEYIMALYKPNQQAVFAQMYPERLLESVHEVKIDGVSLLKIYKNQGPVRQERRLEFKQGYGVIDLPKEVEITRLVVEGVSGCQGVTNAAVVDELVEFIDDEGRRVVYGLMERRQVGDRVEWWFPAERAARVRIQSRSGESCFNQGRLVEIWGV
ncbi:MAG: hypothetical protein HY381_01325 [Candidatus Chisholmbacteria bacterium]|nr:hypothetical protein [Candidatus Chisholmbacteria bacterium]